MSKKAPVYKVTVTLITREAITGDVQAFTEWVLDNRLEDESFVVSFSVDDVEEIGGATKGNAGYLNKVDLEKWAAELEKFSKQLPSMADLMKEYDDE